jgi:hypothetical protein
MAKGGGGTSQEDTKRPGMRTAKVAKDAQRRRREPSLAQSARTENQGRLSRNEARAAPLDVLILDAIRNHAMLGQCRRAHCQ